MLRNYSPCESRRIAECLEIKIVSAVNQICRLLRQKKRNRTENLLWPATGIPRNKCIRNRDEAAEDQNCSVFDLAYVVL